MNYGGSVSKRGSSNDSFQPEFSPSKLKINNKIAIPSFLENISYLSEDDLEVLATYEEEISRK